MKFKFIVTFAACLLSAFHLMADSNAQDREFTYQGLVGSQTFSVTFPCAPNELQGEDGYCILDAGDNEIHYYISALDFRDLPKGKTESNITTSVLRWMRHLENTNQITNPLTNKNIHSLLSTFRANYAGMPLAWSTNNAAIVSRHVVNKGHAYFILAVALKTHDSQTNFDNHQRMEAFAASFALD